MHDDTSIWNYIPVADFEVPASSATEAARGGMLRAWKSIQRVFLGSEPKTKKEASEWNRPKNDLLNCVSPALDWKHPASRFADALGSDWFKTKQPSRLIHPLVGPPGCDVARVLQLLAEQRQLTALTAPCRQSLLEASNANVPGVHAADGSSSEILVIPQLEHWYLRHEDGLKTLRSLLEQLTASRKRVLIGCGSWAWAFFQHAVGMDDLLGEPLTLAPLDAERLDAWFRSTLPLHEYEYRQTGDANPIFPELTKAEKEGKDTENELPTQLESSGFLAGLAARARGNPGVTLALWRACLRISETGADASPPTSSSGRSVLWLSPTGLAMPEAPIEFDQLHHFVLHAILLHGSLSLSLLVAVLPFSHHDVTHRVNELLQACVLEYADDELRVNLTWYPLIRRELECEGLLTDAF